MINLLHYAPCARWCWRPLTEEEGDLCAELRLGRAKVETGGSEVGEGDGKRAEV